MTISQKPLPDIIDKNLKILFIGYNPGVHSAQTGHHYAGKSNRFWKLLFESGLTPELINPEKDKSILKYGFGSTNIVDRTTKSASEITKIEMQKGSLTLQELIKEYTPRIACYVGIGIYRAYKSNLLLIPQTKLSVSQCLQEKSMVEGVLDYVCSNPSGLNTIPYEKQLSCFKELKRLSLTLEQF